MYYCKYCKNEFTTHNHKVMHENLCPYYGAKQGYKFCNTCGKEILLKNFNMDNNRYDKLNSQCKSCIKAYHRNWVAEISNYKLI